MTRYLLDTNIISDLMHAPQGRAAAHVAALPVGTVATSAIVAAEVHYGLAKRGSARLSAQFDAILKGLPVLAFETPADEFYGALRADLERRGSLIGGYGMLIAAHALALDMVLVSDNEREFSRVANLKLENWLR